MLKRAFKALTGAEPGEQLPALLSFLALLFLLLSYYLVKPLRDSLFLTYFISRDQAWFSVPIILLSLASAKFFNHWVGRIPRYRLMGMTFAAIMACKLLFLLLLPISGRWGTIVFFLWASVYFTLVLSILWGVINTIFSTRQAERCFGFVALGATLGNISGAKLSAWLAGSAFKDWALLFSTLGMGVALGLILLAVRSGQDAQAPDTVKASAEHVSRGWQDILALVGNRYVRGLAMMVYALAMISMAIQFQAYSQIDRNTARTVYQETFSSVDASAAQFENVYALKRLDKRAQDASLKTLSTQLSQSPEQMAAGYKHYRDELESRTRRVFSDVYAYQGILGVFLLMVVARLLFRFLGLRWVVLILPLFYAAAAVLLMFPLEVLAVQFLLIVGGALNYSLNNATKELLYTPTSEAVRFQFKPLIEGPVMRLGDVTASLLQILITGSVGVWLALSDFSQGTLLLALGLGFVLVWLLAIWQTGRLYDAAQNAQPPLKELDLNA